jgi:hypothetical protein
MDLNENGTFNDPAIWAPMSDHGMPLYNQLYANPRPYQTDVALIIDRSSILYQRNDIDMKIVQRVWLRNALAKAGVSSGQYYLDDIFNGTRLDARCTSSKTRIT